MAAKWDAMGLVRRIAIPLLLLTNMPSAFTKESPESQSKRLPEVYLVGAIHNMHFESKNNYSLIDLQEQILSIRPDVICGEITPEAFDQPMEGYFPPEAAFLAAMAPTWKVRFVPVDWRMSYILQKKAEAEEPSSVANRVTQLDNKFESGIKNFKGISLYDYFHSSEVISLVDTKFEQIIGENTVADLAAGNWHERNRHIVVNGLAEAKGAKRIVFVFGASHLPQLVRQLKIRGIEAKILPRCFTPSGIQQFPPQVVARWQRNLNNLKAIHDGRIVVSDDAMQKVRNSHRIQDLEQVLQATTIRTHAP
jgi:hypothetical protein